MTIAKKYSLNGETDDLLSLTGGTIVFRPDLYTLKVAELMQTRMRNRLDGFDEDVRFLPSQDLNLELNDLSFPKFFMSPAKEIYSTVEQAEKNVEEVKKLYHGKKVRLTADHIAIREDSESIVLYTESKTAEEIILLFSLHRHLNTYLNLTHRIRPYITLAHFNKETVSDRLYDAIEFAQVSPKYPLVFDFDVETMTCQLIYDKQTYIDVPKKICMVCEGGIVRSVMISSVLNHLARKKGLLISSEPRSAISNPYGIVPDIVWKTLSKNGIDYDLKYSKSNHLTAEDFPLFSSFCGITTDAIHRMENILLFPKEKIDEFFVGLPDPFFGEISYEDAFKEIYELVEKYLDTQILISR